MMKLYLVINHHPAAGIATVEMPSWVPFSPSWLPVYFSLLWVTWLLPVAIRDAGRFRACMITNVVAWLLILPWWILLPTTMPRPLLSHGIWAPAFQWMWSVDEPNNITPCAHGTGPMVGAWFLGQELGRWRWLLLAVVLLALPSIALVWQHRPCDILLGGVAAGISISWTEILVRRAAYRSAVHSRPAKMRE